MLSPLGKGGPFDAVVNSHKHRVDDSFERLAHEIQLVRCSARPNRIEIVEEEEPVPAEQVLNIVSGVSALGTDWGS